MEETTWNNDFEEDDEQFSADFAEQTDESLYEHFRFVADKGQSLLRVDKFLTDRIEGTSRSRIQQAADANYVLANGVAVPSNYKVKPLDVITVVMDRPRHELEIIPEDIPINIVYEDEDVLVVNKAAGMVVHPGHGNYTGTLINAVAWHLKDNDQFEAKDPRMGIVHRIDKDTSGLLVVAKNPMAKTHLGYQFFRKTTKRQYIAVVWGNVKNDTGVIDVNLGRHPTNRLWMTVFPDGDTGKHAVTHYKVLERYGYATLVECHLETGRTHQIRVHMKHIGHTLFNDERYGGDIILRGTYQTKYRQFIYNCFNTCRRQALHAQTLGFVHPRTGEEVFFESPIPEDMRLLIEKWRRYIANEDWEDIY
ncbi:MAG: RluA family pseudouridine synthase [Candidatus Symbiothrix sp.]|jgi:23S rRNA pseudouridine1911/1915/1917 synthase|nr:RluA family pseudouridine synthase [Candidatus Symbiothrix sp.]